ncbi:hydrolase [Neobacillus sp. C211]|uniref:hydrolase n=1 Tax=Bacillaceae TaxID=186817 RepID=UPI001BEAD180|nr:hydrolase [Bacillus sp. ISL-7]MBT2738877.1 hydrolase [Bacillus sp. ISL-7]
MNSEKNECKDCKSKRKRKKSNRCRGCACDQLRKLQTLTEVDVFLSGGTVLEDVIFVSFDPNNCCAFFNDNETEPGSVLIVDCQKIQAIRIEAD